MRSFASGFVAGLEGSVGAGGFEGFPGIGSRKAGKLVESARLGGPGGDHYERLADEPSWGSIMRDRVMGDVAPTGTSDLAGAAEAGVRIQASDLPVKAIADELTSIVSDPTLDDATTRQAERLFESVWKLPSGDVAQALTWLEDHGEAFHQVKADAKAQGWRY